MSDTFDNAPSQRGSTATGRDLPRVVVLLAAHNGVDWLPEQVKSILDQEQVSVSLYISVDRSTDGTERWCDSLALRDDRVTLLRHGECFGSASGNFFRLVQSLPDGHFDYVAFSDQDDFWLPDKLLRAVTVLHRRAVDAYSSNVTAFWPDGRTLLLRKSQPQRKWDFLFEAAGPGCTYVLTKALFADLQEFVLSHAERLKDVDLQDWFFYAFARTRGYTWFIDCVPKMRYRQHASNVHGANAGVEALSRRFRRVLDGWWLGQARTIAVALGLEHHPFVRPWLAPGSRYGYLFLMFNVLECRRRAMDALMMACVMLILILRPPKV